MPTTIDEKSKISIGLLVTFGVVLVWSGKLEARVSYLESVINIVQSIDQRLARIEGALGVKGEKNANR